MFSFWTRCKLICKLNNGKLWFRCKRTHCGGWITVREQLLLQIHMQHNNGKRSETQKKTRKKQDCVLISCSHSVKWKFCIDIISFHSFLRLLWYLFFIFISQSESSIVFLPNLINCSFYRDVYIALILWTEPPSKPNTITILDPGDKTKGRYEEWTVNICINIFCCYCCCCGSLFIQYSSVVQFVWFMYTSILYSVSHGLIVECSDTKKKLAMRKFPLF